MFGSLGPLEIALVLLIIAVLFGGKKLPQLGKGLGEGIMNFKNSLKKDPAPNNNTDNNTNNTKGNNNPDNATDN
ncbi:MAG: twin-arginine translocase TatA/TatE family subunit [bacterium]|nr:twin-arginine translocase TatA/TatE family subunit [bacterium]